VPPIREGVLGGWRFFVGFEATPIVGPVAEWTVFRGTAATKGNRGLVGIQGKLVALGIGQADGTLDNKGPIGSQADFDVGHGFLRLSRIGVLCFMKQQCSATPRHEKDARIFFDWLGQRGTVVR